MYIYIYNRYISITISTSVRLKEYSNCETVQKTKKIHSRNICTLTIFSPETWAKQAASWSCFMHILNMNSSLCQDGHGQCTMINKIFECLFMCIRYILFARIAAFTLMYAMQLCTRISHCHFSQKSKKIRINATKHHFSQVVYHVQPSSYHTIMCII